MQTKGQSGRWNIAVNGTALRSADRGEFLLKICQERTKSQCTISTLQVRELSIKGHTWCISGSLLGTNWHQPYLQQLRLLRSNLLITLSMYIALSCVWSTTHRLICHPYNSPVTWNSIILPHSYPRNNPVARPTFRFNWKQNGALRCAEWQHLDHRGILRAPPFAYTVPSP